MDQTAVIKKPLVTEKSHFLIKEENQYPLIVSKKANKNQIKKAVEELFKVKVTKVRVINVSGKPRRAGRLRKKIMTKGYKKAIVCLKKGDKIPLFEFEGDKK